MKGEGDTPNRGRAPRLRVALGLLLTLFSAFSLSTCGLEIIDSYFDPPDFFIYSGDADSGAASIQLSHDRVYNNSAEFRGYILLYRLYFNKDDAEKDRADILAVSNSSSFPDIVYAQIKAKGFKQLSFSNSVSTPSSVLELLPISTLENSKSVAYTFGFSDWRIEKRVDDLNDSSFQRFLWREDRSALFRLEDISPTDTDVNNDEQNETPTKVYLVLFAIGIGFSAVDISPIYSLPANLNVLTISS